MKTKKMVTISEIEYKLLLAEIKRLKLLEERVLRKWSK